MNRIAALRQPEPESNPPTDWRAIRESMRRTLDDALHSDIRLSNVYTHCALGNRRRKEDKP